MSFTEITACRVCGSTELEEILDLGEQSLTGVFPKPGEVVEAGPVSLVKCAGECELLQLKQTYSLSDMYGENYGYRSGLNPSMIEHLRTKVERLSARVPLKEGDVVLDIGSNDGTTLGFFPDHLYRLGIDPSAEKFRHHYKESVELIVDFFSAALVREKLAARKVKLITSFSMFYDLEDPVAFAQEISDVLEDEGVWCFEQSYMPEMLKQVAYDTVCQEHLEYYAFKQIEYILGKAGLKALDVEFNDVNGGSFSVIAVKQNSSQSENTESLQQLRKSEADFLSEGGALQQFVNDVENSRRLVRDFIAKAKSEGKRVAALGASTKGNVLLQYWGLGPDDIECIGEVNSDKYGCVTPGTDIPIIKESDALDQTFDYYLVLPWHFKTFFLGLDSMQGRTLIFPLPEMEVVSVG